MHSDVKMELSPGILQSVYQKNTHRERCEKMKDRIREEAFEWYESVENRTGQSIETLVDLIMDRTAEALVDEVKTVLKKYFKRWGEMERNG